MTALLDPGVSSAQERGWGGRVSVGDYSFIGMGAAVLPGVTVGRQAVVGANAAVIGDVPDFVTTVGVPARMMSARQVEDGFQEK